MIKAFRQGRRSTADRFYEAQGGRIEGVVDVPIPSHSPETAQEPTRFRQGPLLYEGSNVYLIVSGRRLLPIIFDPYSTPSSIESKVFSVKGHNRISAYKNLRTEAAGTRARTVCVSQEADIKTSNPERDNPAFREKGFSIDGYLIA